MIHTIKIIEIHRDNSSLNSNRYTIKYNGSVAVAVGDVFHHTTNNEDSDDCEIKSCFEILSIISHNTVHVRKLIPAIYAWTNESYQKSNIYKIGLVNWQSVGKRLKQTDTTGVLEKIVLIEKFELATNDPNVTKKVEQTIHNSLKMMKDPITGKSRRVRGDREAFRGDWVTILRPVINNVIASICGKLKTTTQFPMQRHYQYAAEQFALAHYKKFDRGWIHWTCGTGKSYGLGWLMLSMFKNIKSRKNTAIVYVPSKHLIVQTGNDIKEVLNGLGYKINLLSVYSEKDNADAEQISVSLNDANENIITIIISTYQSNQTVRMGLASSKLNNFDVLIGDEIHKTSGEEGKMFQEAIKKTKAMKRLYMTASPVCYNQNDHGFSGQENESLYGKCFHSYGFLEAVFDKYIAPLEIYGLGIEDLNLIDDLKSLIDYNHRVIPMDNDWDINHSNFTYISMLHITLLALSQGLITHPIVYTNRVARGIMFADDLIKLADRYNLPLTYNNVRVLSGDDNVKDRVTYINDHFSNHEISVLINSRCLQEGVSAPKADSVIIIDPRHSAADLVQIIGRPVRLDKQNPNKVAKIIIPLTIERNFENKIILNETKYATTRDWLIAIMSSDNDFRDYIASNENSLKLDFNFYTRCGISFKDTIDPNEPRLPSTKTGEHTNHEDIAPYIFDNALINSLRLEVLNKTSPDKIKLQMSDTEVKEKNLNIIINDFLMTQKRKGKMYMDKFDFKQRNKYASYYGEDQSIMIEEIISKTGSSKEDIQKILIGKYFNILNEIEKLKNNIKKKVAKTLVSLV